MTAISPRVHAIRLVMAGLAVALFGWLVGHPLVVILVALSLLGIWNLINMFRLRRWLINSDTGVPESLGMWSEIFDRINRLEKSSRKRQEDYRAVIRDFQSLTDALPDATLVIDLDDNISWFNNAARLALGLKTPDDLGQAVTNLLREPDFANWLSVQHEIHSQLEMESPADPNTWYRISAVNYGENQRLIIMRDISDLHRVDSVRRDFVANISHELRTPLTVVLGYLELLQQDENPSTADIAEKIHAQAMQMQELLADLMELCRLQSDRISHDEGTIAVPAMLAQLKEQLEELSQGKHHLIFKIQEDLHLSGVSSDIESVFRNLLVNAVRYTPAGGTVTATWKLAESGPVFEVTDNGIGIPKREIPRLTERFYRVQSDRSRKSGGTGLGLAIVKHVLNAHQAKLQIRSELGEGSTFSCHFPEERIRPKAERREVIAS